MSASNKHHNEAGVALVTVLMIVASMSIVAVMISSAVLASTNRAKTLDASAQADWFVAGADQFAALAIEDLVATSGARLFDGMPGLSQAMNFDLEGGVISITGTDATNCFNVNRLRDAGRAAAGDASEVATSVRDDFEMLLDLAGLEGLNPETMTSAVIDWMDPDQSPGLGGAEDSYYAGLPLPYRTSGQPLASLSELRAIRYFEPDLIDALDPLLCAYPSEENQVFNINTLTEQEAPLLSLAMSGALTVEAARDVLFQRPPGGWESVSTMMELPELAQISPELRRADMLSVEASHIGVRTVIEYRGLRRIYDVLFSVEENGSVTAIRRERKG